MADPGREEHLPQTHRAALIHKIASIGDYRLDISEKILPSEPRTPIGKAGREGLVDAGFQALSRIAELKATRLVIGTSFSSLPVSAERFSGSSRQP